MKEASQWATNDHSRFKFAQDRLRVNDRWEDELEWLDVAINAAASTAGYASDKWKRSNTMKH